MRASEIYETAVEDLKNRLPKLKSHTYDSIDNLMQDISFRHRITGKKLHDLFVHKYGHTPDTWIKKLKDRLEEQGVAEGSTDLVQIEYWQQETMESGRWVKTKPMPRATAEKIVNSFERGEIVDVEQGVAEGAPELLKKEMPLHRHAEKLLAQNGVNKDDPEYHHHLGNTIKHLRQFGNIDLINKQGVAEGLNEFAPDGFNGGDDDEGFSPEIAKMAQEDGFTKGVSLADGATLERAMTINYWHSQHGGMYKQYFAKGFKEGRMNKVNHDNKQYNLNLKLMKDGSIRHGEQGVAEGWTKLPSGDYQNSHTGVRTSKPPAKKKRGEKTGAEWDAIEKAKKEQGVAEGLNEFAPDGFNGGDDDDGNDSEYMRGYKDGDGYPKVVKSSKGKEIWMHVTPKNPPLTDRYLQGWNDAKYGSSPNQDLINLDKLGEQGVAEGQPKEKEADYGPDYQDMVARVKKLAGMGPLKTVYDPAKRVYRNVPTAVQPKKEQR